VLLRRTRLGLLAAREICGPDNDISLRVARAMAPERGWDPDRGQDEVRAFGEEARAEGIAVEVG
jgi:glycerol-3-phosphate dehydrogenase